VVFGPGSLRFAHSNEEQIHLDDIATAAAILARFIIHWCEQTGDKHE
jgi:acetylornithine deacetylase/succinyl-diaminopimelate desuccinylase-like protein